MRTHRFGYLIIIIFITLPLVFWPLPGDVNAMGGNPLGPDRYELITQDYQSYEWWLSDWSDNQVICSIIVDHEDLPNGSEIFSACGQAAYDTWNATQPCQDAETSTACSGYYLQFVKSTPAQREVGLPLPAAVVWVTLDGCVPENSTYKCSQLPTLVLSGDEPLPGQFITSIAGRINGEDFLCDPTCQIDLAPTGEDGLELEFWANSSYGDTSELYQARVRVIGSDETGGRIWYTDVISNQWRGASLAGCSQVWNSFPPVGGPPEWLSTPQRPEELESNIPYTYLAANLIRQGISDASACEDGGILENGMASPCGVDAARPEVNHWQNRFDSLIFSSSKAVNIPAQLIKNIFSIESQFWPGVIIGHPEAGLGQLTQNGADTAFLWNQPFYEQFCATVLDDSQCRKGYSHLQSDQQALLQNSLVKSVDAYCEDCPLGVDITKTENSVVTFAEVMQANCEQVGMIVYNTYNKTPGEETSYEDLWRLTLVNYNAGPGCLTLAIKETKQLGESLDWVNLSAHLTPACMGAIKYVDDVSQYP